MADTWSSSTGRTFGWVSIAVGAEGAAVGIATSFMLLHQNSIRDDSCNAQHLCSQAGITANDNIRSLAWWNTGAWIVAAAGLGAGAFLLLTNPSDTSARTAVGVTPNGSGLNLSARSVF